MRLWSPEAAPVPHLEVLSEGDFGEYPTPGGLRSGPQTPMTAASDAIDRLRKETIDDIAPKDGILSHFCIFRRLVPSRLRRMPLSGSPTATQCCRSTG